MVVPKPAVTTFLKDWPVITWFCSSVDSWYHTPQLGPLYQLTFWFNMFDDVVNEGHHFGSFKVFLDVDVHLGNLPLLLIILMPFSQYEFFQTFQSSVLAFNLVLPLIHLLELMDVS